MLVSQQAMTGTQPIQPLSCFDAEDVEGWLIEEGIGHLDRSGNFQYGPSPFDECEEPIGFFDESESDFLEEDGKC